MRAAKTYLPALFIAAAAALALSACGEQSLPQRTIHLSVPLSGPLAARGQDLAHAARLSLKQTNSNTSNTAIKLVVTDSAKRLDLAAAAADKNALAFVGGLSIDEVKSSARADNSSGLLQIALAPAPTNATAARHRLANVIWQLPSAPGQGDALAQYVASNTQAEIGYYGDGSSFGSAVYPGFMAGVERAGIREVKVDAANVPVVGAGSEKGFVQADDPANSTAESPHTLITAGMTADSYPPAGERFFKAFADEFDHQPDRFAIYAYEAIGLIVDAIERLEGEGKKATRASVRDQVFRIKNRFGPVGHYDVLPSGRTTLYVFQARGGEAPDGDASLIEALR